MEERWASYVDNYIRLEPTGKYFPTSVVFLKRNERAVRSLADDPRNIEILNRLECKISVNTYRMFFVENSEDYFHRKGTSSTQDKLQKARKAKEAKFTKFIDGPKGWKQDKTQNPEELAKQTQAFFLGESGKTQQIEVTDASGAKFCKYITTPANPLPSSQPSSATSSPTKPKKGSSS